MSQLKDKDIKSQATNSIRDLGRDRQFQMWSQSLDDVLSCLE